MGYQQVCQQSGRFRTVVLVVPTSDNGDYVP